MLSEAALNVISVTVLACVPLGLALLFVVYFWKTPLSFVQRVLYLVNMVVARLLWRCQVIGHLGLPPNQGAVIVCNHKSGIDPFFVALAVRQVVHWMVAREFVEMPILSWAFKQTEAIPVSRGGVDTAATKLAIRLTQQGQLVGLFPEGRINNTQEILLPGRPGAALIAIKANVPVIPCFLEGAPYAGTWYSSFFMRAKVRLVIGKPIYLNGLVTKAAGDDRRLAEVVTLELLKAIARLGGAKDYEPRIASRTWKTDPQGTAASNGQNGTRLQPAENGLPKNVEPLATETDRTNTE